MGNHDVPCPMCDEDMRGLMGVPGCYNATDAAKCSYYKQRQELEKRWAEQEKKEGGL